MPASARLNTLLKMINEQPDDPFIMFALSKEYAKTGKNDLALELFRKLKTMHPEYIGTYFHMVRLLHDMELITEAEKTLTEGLDIATRLGDHHAYAELKALSEDLP